MLRILIAEDNRINQKVVIKMLKKIGHTAKVVNDGIEAVAAVRRSTFDVILMDVMMPNLDGLNAARQIRTDESPEHHAHIIALTANAMGADRLRCLEAGMDDYISKPFLLETLRKKIQAVVDDRRVADTGAINVDCLRSFIEMMGDDDSAFIQELLSDYLVDAERMRVAIHLALKTEDASTIRHIGHTLKSSSAVFGALILVDICEEFEGFAETGNLEAVRIRLPRFDEILRDVNVALSRVAETGRV